jgi:uncharacterized membrane protein YkoI
MKKWWIAALTAFLAITMAIIGISVAIAGGGSNGDAVQNRETQEAAQVQDVQEPSYQASVKVAEPEPQDLSGLEKITADQAKEAALAAEPGSTITKVELDNENGNLVWSVEFSSGVEVKVDAGNGQVLHTENPDPNEPREKGGET